MKKCLHAGTAALLVLGASGFVHLPARRHFQPVATARSARRAAAKSTFAPRGSTTRLFSAAADKAALKEGGEGEEEGEEEDEPATEEDCSPIFEDACLVEEDAALMSKRAKMKKLLGTKPVQLTMYLFLWYFFNAGFNVSNKQVLNKFPHPWIVAWFQLATGLLWVLPSWKTGIRQAPIVDRKLLLLFLPIALLHSSGHAAQVASMGLGTVFFTHVIKAAEPLVGTLVVLFATGKIAPWYVNICLAPVVGGVAYAAGKPGMRFDVSDLWSLPSILALLSTVAFAIAKLLAKNLMNPDMKKERRLGAANNYALLTCCSSAVLFLPSLLLDGKNSLQTFNAMGADKLGFSQELLICGMMYYAYNEMGFRVLDLLDPVMQAVANSAKRVVILFAAVAFLGESVTTRKLIGSAIAIGGVTLYSLAKALSVKGKPKKKKVVIQVVEEVEAPGTWQP